MTRRPAILAGLLAYVPAVALADAPRGSSYAEDIRETSSPPVQTLVGDASADLRVKRLPARLRMREKTKAVAQAGDAKPTAEADGAAGVSYKMFPTTTRDLRERVTFRIRAGVALDNAPANDETQRGGLPLPDGFADNRTWLVGDAAIGARGIVVPSLNGYLLSSFAFDASDALATRTVTVSPYDNQQLVIKAGYAEWGRDDRKPDDQQPYSVWLRGGRQFRLDGGNLFAYYDGVTLGYRDETWNASVFGGQRVALFVNTEPGLLYGATAGADLKRLKTRVAVNYMGLAISSNDFDGDGELDGETRHMIHLTTTTKVSRKLKLDTRVRLTGLPDVGNTEPGEIPGTKFAPGRISARLRYEAERLVVIGDVEQRFEDDVAYDLAAPSLADVSNIANRIGVLNAPIDSTSAGVRLDWQNQKKSAEVLAFARVHAPNQTPVFVDQRAYIEGGGGLAGTPIGVRGSGVYTTAHYTYRQYTDEGVDGDMRIDGACNDLTDNDMDGFPDNCLAFNNTASSGLDRMHQLAAEATLASRGSGGRRWRFTAGGFFRVFDFRTPYREVKNDARGGGRVDLQIWLNRDLHLDFAGEVAQPSPTLAREIGVMSAVRAALEARW
jgi:hypothetical protein